MRSFMIGSIAIAVAGPVASCGEVPPQPAPDASGTDPSDTVIDGSPQPDLHVDWAHGLATVGRDEVDAVTFSPTGTAIVLARFTGTLTLGATTLTSGSTGTATSILVARFDPAGALISAFAFGGASSVAGSAIVRDGSDNIYVAGSFTGTADFAGTQRTSVGSSDGFVARFNPAGGLTWVTTFGNTGSDVVRGLAITPDNNLAIAGQFVGAITLGTFTLDAGAGADALVAKLSTGNGAAIWAHQDGLPTANEVATQIASDANGSVYVAGRYTGATSIAGRTFPGAGSQDGYVEKLAGDGTAQWAVTLGGAGSDQASSLIVRDDQSIVVSGNFTGSMTLPNNTTLAGAGGVDVFVLGLSPLGTQTFAVALGGPDHEGPTVIARDGADTTIVAVAVGISGATIASRALGGAGGLDLALVGLDPTGKPRWARSFGGAGDDRALSIATHAGTLLVGGATSSPMLQLGATTLNGAGVDDGVLARFDASPL